MPQQTLKQVAEDFKKVQPAIDDAEELLVALKEAGEPTAELEKDLRALKTRKAKWQRMLSARNLL